MSDRDDLLRQLGITPAPEAAPHARRQQLRELGLNATDYDPDTAWLPVVSSNVAALRWVGGLYGLQVRFLAKRNSPEREYEYACSIGVYEKIQLDPSTGGAVDRFLKKAGVPYRRIK